MNLEIRYAKPSESKLILEFIKGIAEYEKLSDQVTTNEEELYISIFVEKSAKVIIAFLDDIPVGFALFFYNFSTFKGRKGLYLEDLFVYKEYRGKVSETLYSIICFLKQKRTIAAEWNGFALIGINRQSIFIWVKKPFRWMNGRRLELTKKIFRCISKLLGNSWLLC